MKGLDREGGVAAIGDLVVLLCGHHNDGPGGETP